MVMAANNETTPHKSNPDEPDEFDLIAGELTGDMEDPYLVERHKEARECESLLRSADKEDANIIYNLVTRLDAKWAYNGQELDITGQVWEKDPVGGQPMRRTAIGEKMISRGFTFLSTPADNTEDEIINVGHYLEHSITDDNGDIHVVHSVLLLDDIYKLNLPTPSPAAREQRFAYRHAEEAVWIDELAFTARRDDQVLSDFRAFYMDIDQSTEEGAEALRNAEEYLRRRAGIEPLANYQVSVLGPAVLLEKKDGKTVSGTVLNFKAIGTIPMHIQDIKLKLADIHELIGTGRRRYTPYIETVAFQQDGENRNLLIPCTSIHLIHSVRYNDAP